MAECGPLLELDDVRQRLQLWSASDAGVQAIAVERIVGTSDRCCDFDRCFKPLRGDLGERVGAVARAFGDGGFSPIEVVQVDRAYFVVDGHKRVAAARMLSVDSIDAHVTRLPTPLSIDEHVDQAGVALLEAENRFRSASGLAPRIRCLSPAGFGELTEAIKAHGYDLMRERGELLDDHDVAADWYTRDYLPTLEAARRNGLAELLSCCPEGELYLALHRQARALTEAEENRARAAADQLAREHRDSAHSRRLGFLRRRA
jgi:hypothetical protein